MNNQCGVGIEAVPHPSKLETPDRSRHTAPKYHYLYCIENIDDQMFYVGKHTTSDLNDGYMGSGTLLCEAYRKKGLARFRKHILAFFDSEQEVLDAERFVVDEEFLSQPNVYNRAVGGNDGWLSINKNESLRKEKNHRAALSMNKTIWSDPEFRERNRIRTSEQTKKLHAEGKVSAPDWSGRKHREETKRKIGEKNSSHQTGEGNSQFGTVWIRNELGESRKISKDDLKTFLSKGWIRGRKMKLSLQA